MPRDFFAPIPEQQNFVLIDSATQKAQRMIAGCDACSEDGEIPFDTLARRDWPVRDCTMRPKTDFKVSKALDRFRPCFN